LTYGLITFQLFLRSSNFLFPFHPSGPLKWFAYIYTIPKFVSKVWNGNLISATYKYYAGNFRGKDSTHIQIWIPFSFILTDFSIFFTGIIHCRILLRTTTVSVMHSSFEPPSMYWPRIDNFQLTIRFHNSAIKPLGRSNPRAGRCGKFYKIDFVRHSNIFISKI